jgi:hypothetical protein
LRQEKRKVIQAASDRLSGFSSTPSSRIADTVCRSYGFMKPYPPFTVF